MSRPIKWLGMSELSKILPESGLQHLRRVVETVGFREAGINEESGELWISPRALRRWLEIHYPVK